MKEGTMSFTALITGASGGIGYELAKLFARDGNNLVLVARSGDKLGQLAGELEKAYKIRASVVAVDLALADGPDQVFMATQKAGIDVDVLVNNAGFGSLGSTSRPIFRKSCGRFNSISLP